MDHGMRLDHADKKAQRWRDGSVVESSDSSSIASGFDFTQSHGKTWPLAATVLRDLRHFSALHRQQVCKWYKDIQVDEHTHTYKFLKRKRKRVTFTRCGETYGPYRNSDFKKKPGRHWFKYPHIIDLLNYPNLFNAIIDHKSSWKISSSWKTLCPFMYFK